MPKVKQNIIILVILNIAYLAFASAQYAVLIPFACLFGLVSRVFQMPTKRQTAIAAVMEGVLLLVPFVLGILDTPVPAYVLAYKTQASLWFLVVSLLIALQVGRITRGRLTNAQKIVKEKTVKAETDKLTGLPNRQSMNSFIIKQASFAMPFSVIMMDIDNFKKVNDTYGHTEGDAILKDLADTIKQSIRQGDKCFRYGGEEFCVVCPQTTSENAKAVAERIRATFNSHEHHYEGENEPRKFSVSLGLAECKYGEFVAYDAEGQEIENDEDKVVALINKADSALYKAKHTGKNKVVVFFPEETA